MNNTKQCKYGEVGQISEKLEIGINSNKKMRLYGAGNIVGRKR